MTKHNEFSRMYFKTCKCHRKAGEWTSLKPWHPTVAHEADKVEFTCTTCGGAIGSFYRMPDREQKRTYVNSTIATISAPRTIGWVGYAKNPATVQISDDGLLRGAAKELLRCLDTERSMIALFFAEDGAVKEDENENAIQAAISVLIAQGNGRLYGAMRQQARYKILGEIYRTEALRHRGFWFHDRGFAGEVVCLASCETGRQYPSHSSYSSYDGDYDYEPGGLDGGTYQRLYCVQNEQGYRALIHPLDVIEEGE